VRLTYKYRLYPTTKQSDFLDSQLREACDLYNCALEERRSAWNVCRKPITYYEQSYQLKAMRAEGLIGLANFSCCQEVLRRVDNTYMAFFARVKRGDKPGFPRFKPIRRYRSITFTYGDGCRLLANGRLYVQGCTQIKIKLHRPIDGNIKTVTIKRDLDQWYVCFSVITDCQPLVQSAEAIGIDVGLESFAVLSDGTTIENPRYQNHSAAILRRRRRRVARRKKTSKRRAKAWKLAFKTQRYLGNQRAALHHNLSRWLVDRYGFIAIENLNVSGLSRGILAGPVKDVAWSSFFQKLSYKAESAGRVLVKVEPQGTSQKCVCGASVPKTLADRWHNCPVCGLSAGRDHVSAQVILQRARIEPSGANVEEVISSVS